MTIESDIKQKAFELGFDAVGITTAAPVEPKQVEYFHRWLQEGNAAGMGYLYRNIEKRFDPAKLLNGAKSVICVALNYRSAKNNRLEACPTLRIANFAQYEDYHPFIKERLFQLAEFIGNSPRAVAMERGLPARAKHSAGKMPAFLSCDRDNRAPKFKACVDSVPLAERALAQRAGLGFIGKNHMLIHPELGNQILLGELITTLELGADKPLENQSCGNCGKCIRACPTGALGHDGSFDARKCISYLTIEDGSSPQAVAMERGLPARAKHSAGKMPAFLSCGRDARAGNYIFGCDECILACPHEMNKPPRQNMEFQFHPEWQKLTPEQIQSMTEDDFQKTFANSGFIRLGLKRLKRNVKASQRP